MRNRGLLIATTLLASAATNASAEPNAVPAKATPAKAAAAPRAPQAAFNCAANASWFTSPSLPTEVKKSGSDGSSNFCDFYQFTWQTFAYLMASSKASPSLRNFQDNTQYNQLEVNKDGTPANSCDDKHDSNTLFVRTVKPLEGGTTFLIPEKIGQAGGGATIYDQQGNVVYYDVRFSKGMCDVNGIKQLQNFPGGTTELKTAWKVMGPSDDASKYITMDAKIGTQPTTTKLGMVGFHVAAATPDHPEFVWATFEHAVNSPNCVSPTTSTGWSFASKTCSQNLQNKDPLGIVQCSFNDAKKQTSTTGSATQICREYPYGSAPSDLKFAENTQDITSLNSNVRPYLVGNFAVLNNYFNVGDLWVSDIAKSSIVGQPGSAQVANQRGSLRLANTVAETDFQAVDLTQPFVSNCFGCHNYVGTALPASGKNTTSGNLSHIFDDIAIGVGQCLDVQAGSVINSQPQAKTQCPGVCTNASAQFTWNGQWTNQDAKTHQQLPMTVCGCCGQKPGKR
jgi:hypothetical protein